MVCDAFRTDGDNDQGAAAVIVAVMIVALLAVAALTVDVGALYAERRQMQSAADAAALAGVQELPDDPGTALLVADEYAEYNTDATATAVVSSVLYPNDTITTTVEDPTYGLFFARFFQTFDPGASGTAAVGANAVARVVSPSAVSRGVMPFGVLDGAFPYGETRELKLFESAELSRLMCLTDPPGGGAGTALIVDQIKSDARDVTVYVGGTYETGPKVNGQPILKAVDQYIGTNADLLTDIATLVEATPGEPPVIEIRNYDSPRLWVCPVLDITTFDGVSPGDAIVVKGFTYLYIPVTVPDCPEAQAAGIVGQPNPSLKPGTDAWLYTQVVRPLSPDEIDEWGAYDPDGAYAFRLVE